MLNRLITRDRLHKFKKNSSIMVDCIYNGHKESRDHLFFECSFSAQVWFLISQKFPKLHCSTNKWSDLVLWAAAALRRKTKPNIEAKLAWQAGIYRIWLERNKRIFQNVFQTVDGLLGSIL